MNTTERARIDRAGAVLAGADIDPEIRRRAGADGMVAGAAFPDRPGARESVADAAARIRDMQPIAGGSATDEECAVRRDLIELTLATWGVRAGKRCWFTGQLVTGRIVGVWAQSEVEAELDLSVWWAQPCLWVVPDPDLRVRNEHLPRTAAGGGAERVFPAGPPRTPRDRFAPATPLWTDDTVAPESASLGIG